MKGKRRLMGSAGILIGMRGSTGQQESTCEAKMPVHRVSIAQLEALTPGGKIDWNHVYAWKLTDVQVAMQWAKGLGNCGGSASVPNKRA